MADGLYNFYGQSQPDVNFELKANSVRTTAKGERALLFKDGTKITITYPVYYMRGMLVSIMDAVIRRDAHLGHLD